MRIVKSALLAAIAAVGTFGPGAPANAADTFAIDYYTIKGTYGAAPGDPDFNTIGCCTGVYYDSVKPQLGPDGLPVFNTSAVLPYTIHDTNAAGEITWWSPTLNSNVTHTGSGTVTNPFANYSFFPPDGTGNNDGPGNNFQGAIISGVFNITTPETATFSFGADDDAFLALDGTIIAQEGGIHGVAAAPVTSSILATGQHAFKLFYVDRNQTGAGLYFSVDTAGITVVPPPPVGGVPEPASWALLIASFGAVGFAARRRRLVPRSA